MKSYAVSIEICRVKTREDADALAKYMSDLVGDFPDAYVCVSEYQETPKSIIASFRPPKTLEQRNLPARKEVEVIESHVAEPRPAP